MKEILDDVGRWQERGEKVAIATVVATRRSAPRPVGSKLAISESGELAGSVSGGCVAMGKGGSSSVSAGRRLGRHQPVLRLSSR